MPEPWEDSFENGFGILLRWYYRHQIIVNVLYDHNYIVAHLKKTTFLIFKT